MGTSRGVGRSISSRIEVSFVGFEPKMVYVEILKIIMIPSCSSHFLRILLTDFCSWS